jgi:hypothetical protein
MKVCINCGAPLDNHPRRKYCDKPECQRKRLNENQKKYQKNARALLKQLKQSKNI